MVEVVFSESAAGSLSVAASNRNYGGSFSSSVIFGTEEKDSAPNWAEIQRMMQESAERERLNWEKAIPLQVERKDILCFPLSFDIGEISEDRIEKQRENTLETLFSIYPESDKEAAQDMLETARISLKDLIYRAENGEDIRVWTSDFPNDCCGFCWMMDQLKHIGFKNLNIISVKLPDFHVMSDGTVVIYSGWGDVPPHQWGYLAQLGRKIPVNYMHALALKWQRLKEENSTLRAVVNRQLVSVPDEFYDSFIFQELIAQEDEFMEAELIGKLIGKYSLGISDCLIAMRIEKFIKEGLLMPITKAEKNSPVYHRMLRKCNCPRT